MKRHLQLGCVALALAAAMGCKRGSLRDGASPTGQVPDLRLGDKLVLWDPGGVDCPARTAASERDAKAGRGIPLAGHASIREPVEVVITGVESGSEGIVRVQQPNGTHTWLLLPRGKELGCVHRDVTALRKAASLVGRELVFAPWRPQCSAIHVAGQAPEAILVDAEGVVRLRVTGWRLGASSPGAAAQGKPGAAVWVRFADGLVDVRADTVNRCFVEPDDPLATRPSSVEALLAPGRCEVDAAEPRHTICRSTVTVWTGGGNANAFGLRRVRRTLGPLHFFDGQPVEGSRFATTVVAVTQAPPTNEDIERLYRGVGAAVQHALVAASGGSVRGARPDETEASHRVHISVSDVTIGNLVRHETTATSEYKERDEERPNPKKSSARARVDRARERVQDTRRDFDEASRDAQQRKQQLYEQCKQQAAAISKPGWSSAASTGCDIGNVAIDVRPSRAALDAAESELRQAESAYDSEPETITVPIMRTHSYKKVLYSRRATASLTIELTPRGGDARVQRIPVSFDWQDYEVGSEPQFNVAGHAPDAAAVADPKTILGPLGRRVAEVVAQEVKRAVFSAAREESMRAFLAAGNDPPKPGFEHVDALAFETAGKRLLRVALRGRAQLLPKAGFSLPTAAATLSATECLLAVAAAPAGAEDARISLRSPDESHADLRTRPFAVVEVCSEELDGRRASLEAQSETPVEARWGLYVTRRTP